MMENFDDEFGDLSGYKILSFEEVTQGFEGNKNFFSSSFGSSNKNISYQNDEYINLTMLLGNIKTANGSNGIMQYVYQEYQQDIAQTYIMDGQKHIDLSARIGLKNGVVKVSNKFSRDRPYMEVFFDENDKLTYVLTFCYVDTHDTAIELRTHSFQEYRNLLLYLNYGDVEKDYDASTFFIREFTNFLTSSESSDDLYQVYGDLPTSFILKIQLSTDVVAKHLKILTKEDDTGWFSWTRDTSSLLIKVMGMFRKFQEAADYFWKNPKVLTEIYDNLDGRSEILGQSMSNRILFASVLNKFAASDKNAKRKITPNALVSTGSYFIESNILELNDTLNTMKGIMSFDWDFDYKDAVFLQQKRKVKQNVKIVPKEGDPVAEETVTEDVDPGYLYHPMNLVCYSYDSETGQKAELVTALFIKALADEKEWTEVLKYIRIGGDIFAIIAGLFTMGAAGELSLLAITDLALASVDLSLMDEDVRKWLSQYPEGKWFVENWDLIYALVGAGIMSVVIMEGILTYGPMLLENLKNLKNVKGNYRIFTEQLEKLIAELEAYQARNAANVIEEVTLVGEKNGLLKKLLQLVSSPGENLQFIVEDIAKKGLSVRKVAENEYEVLYKGQVLKTGKDYEAGAFLRKYFWKSARNAEELLRKELFTVLKKLETFTINLDFKGIIYEMTKKGNTIIWRFSDDLSTFPNRAELSEYGFISYNFKIPDQLLKKPYGGFGQQFLNESFEIFGEHINGAIASWNENPSYPGGSSLGYKQFWEVFNKTQNQNEALKATTFYKTMSKKGISKITERSVNFGEFDEIDVIIYKKNFK
ncbi:hypothetical protein [Chryseobacterium hispalense]|uniref:hypothetical protein n=1 Tax=Chryseobacterium hispalense TaxID=1453492 RepID=UPI000A76BE2B|nr:hypothetical protein [Chryseobacterium hispalense]